MYSSGSTQEPKDVEMSKLAVQEPVLGEYPIFLLMGCLGGLVGAAFVHLNVKADLPVADNP